jgi:hypothetical protein
MGKFKNLLHEWTEGLKVNTPSDLSDCWVTKDLRLLPIKDMDFQHLENIVNYFSQEGTTVDPIRQAAFEKVMLLYLRKQAEINDVHKDIL